MVGTTEKTVADLTVEKGKVEEFARAIKSENPVHRDEDAAEDQGFERIPAPLTFTRVGMFPRYSPDEGINDIYDFDLGLNKEHVLHGEQGYKCERPLLVGDTIYGETEICDVYERDGRRGGKLTFVEFQTEYYDEDDNLVLTEYQTVVETTVDEDNDSDIESDS